MRWSIFLQILASTAAFIACQDAWVSQARHDNCWGCSLCRWPLPLSCLQAWSVYWWLSWTDGTGRGGSKLHPFCSYVAYELSSRCTAPAEDLDSSRYPSHSKEHTELISAEFELGQLWDEYGLVGDIVVSMHTIIWHFKLMYCLAIYKQLPMSWYSRTSITWLTTSTHQRLLQGSFSNVDHQIHWRQQLWCSSKADTRQYWPPVSHLIQNWNNGY